MIHERGCDCGAYACRLRGKGIQVSPQATPSSRNAVPPAPPTGHKFNSQIVYQDRPGGTKMPILTPQGDVLRIKQYNEQKHKINDQLARVRAGQPA